MSTEIIAFIMYITGHSKETIEKLYETWLRVKDDPEFEEYHPELAKKIKQLTENQNNE